MSDGRSDALVFFGATGDLAYKKIFPALPRHRHEDLRGVCVPEALQEQFGFEPELIAAAAREMLARQ
jgi:glucose-6-phosphate 1-dehydrogenase